MFQKHLCLFNQRHFLGVLAHRHVKFVTFVYGLILFLAATSPPHSFVMQPKLQCDSRHYIRMAKSAADGTFKRHGFYQKDRFVGPWLCGLGSKKTGMNLEQTFRMTVLTLTALSIIFLFGCLKAAGVGVECAYGMTAISALHPYFFRYYLTHTAMFPDLIFILGSFVALYGALRNSLVWIALGVAVGVMGRQNAVLFIPAAVGAVCVSARRPSILRLGVLSIVLLTWFWVICRLVIGRDGAQFFGPFLNTVRFSITERGGYFREWKEFVRDYAFIFFPNLPYLSILSAAMIRRPKLLLEKSFWPLWVFYAGLCGQYLFLTHHWMGQVGARYSWLIAGPLMILAGLAMDRSVGRLRCAKRTCFWVGLLLLALMGTGNYYFFPPGGLTYLRKIFMLLYLTSSLLMFGWAWVYFAAGEGESTGRAVGFRRR
jgi:hypothetical protein